MPVYQRLPKIHFDFGAISALPGELAELGIDRPLIVSDKGLAACGVLAKVMGVLPAAADYALCDEIPENPTVAGVERAMEVYREKGCDGIVAVGGGSVLDTGKAARVLVRHGGNLEALAAAPERIGAGLPPYVAIPTTAGTGAEITAGGGIHATAEDPAFGLRSPHIKADVAICDPELTLTLPPALTAGTGMDALGHCIEGYLAPTVNPPLAAVALDGIRRVVGNIETAVADGANREARWEMLMAALEGGMAIHLGLGPVHALAGVFGIGRFHHGTLVTLATPPVLRYLEGTAGAKMARIHDAMGLDAGTDVATAIERINERIGLPPDLRAMGWRNDDLDTLAGHAAASHFNATAPKVPTREEYRSIIAEMLG